MLNPATSAATVPGTAVSVPRAVARPEAPVEVVAVEGKAALAEFIALPAALYAGDPLWVPPLRRDERRFFSSRNPYLRRNPVRLFLARRGGRAVGRIAATVCREHNTYHRERAGFFGFFECDGEPETAERLLAAAADFLRADGMEVMRGPFNLTTNHTCGLLVEGFDGPPLLDMPYNPPAYPALLAAAGLTKAKDLVALWRDAAPDPALAAAAGRAPAGYRVRELHLSGRGFAADMETFFDLYHHAWRDNWGFVPIDREEFGFLAERLRPALAAGYSFVAEVDGAPAGMFIGAPDLNRVLALLGGRLTPLGVVRAWLGRRRVDAARLLLAGIYEAYRGTPVAALLLDRFLAAARVRGDRGVEASWVLEDNEPARRFFGRYGFEVYRRYRIYERPLG